MIVKLNNLPARHESLIACSETADGRVKEDATREVGIAPLSEGCLLFEISLDSREVLLLWRFEILVIGRLEVIVIFDTFIPKHRVTHLSQILSTKRDRLRSTSWNSWVSVLLQVRQTSQTILPWSDRTLHELSMLVTSGCISWTHQELFSHIQVSIAIDKNSDLACIAPLVSVLWCLSCDESIDFCFTHAFFLTLIKPFWQFVMISIKTREISWSLKITYVFLNCLG